MKEGGPALHLVGRAEPTYSGTRQPSIGNLGQSRRGLDGHKPGPNMRRLIAAQAARMQGCNLDGGQYWANAAVATARWGALADASEEEIAAVLLRKLSGAAGAA